MPDSFFVSPAGTNDVADKLFNVVKQKNVYLTVILRNKLTQLRHTLLFGPEPMVREFLVANEKSSNTMTLGNYVNDEYGELQMWREASVMAMLLMAEGHNVFVGTMDKRDDAVLLPAYELYEDHLERIAEERSSR